MEHFRRVRNQRAHASHTRSARSGRAGVGSRSARCCLRSAQRFFDLQQADRVLESETNNVQAADQALDIAKSNFAAGLGTQLDILQAASDVTRTRTTRLSAIYFAQRGPCPSGARLREFDGSAQLRIKIENAKNEKRNAAQAADVACPPNKLGQR